MELNYELITQISLLLANVMFLLINFKRRKFLDRMEDIIQEDMKKSATEHVKLEAMKLHLKELGNSLAVKEMDLIKREAILELETKQKGKDDV